MKLAERRAATEFEETKYPELKSQIEKAAGFPVPVEVEWNQLAIEGESHLYNDSWSAVYFEPLISALQTVARDDMGRKALKDGLHKVVIQNTKGCYYADKFASFADGVLTLDHEPHTNAGDVAQRTKALVQLLESNL